MFEIVRQLDLATQNEILVICRQLVSEAPLFRKTMPNGANFSYLCTSAGAYGWLSDRRGYRYETHHPLTGCAFPPIPALIADIAIETAQTCGYEIRPETALINWYDAKGKLGLHLDNTERCSAPVISISIGDSCIFIKGGLQRKDPTSSFTLASGDVMIMGGEDRYRYHGVRRIVPDTSPEGLDIHATGRINITIRQVKP